MLGTETGETYDKKKPSPYSPAMTVHPLTLRFSPLWCEGERFISSGERPLATGGGRLSATIARHKDKKAVHRIERATVHIEISTSLRARQIATVLCIALAALITVARNDSLLPLAPNWASNLSIAIFSLIFAALSVAAYRAPHRISPRMMTIAAICSALAGGFLWKSLNPYEGIGAHGNMSSIAIFFLAELFFGISRAWATTLAALALSTSPDSKQLLPYACIGVGAAYALRLALPVFDQQPAPILIAFLLICLLTLSHKLAAKALLTASGAESPHDLEVTNPFSFIPLTSHFYLCIFLFEMTFGFSVYLNYGGAAPLQYAFICLALLGAGVYAAAGNRSVEKHRIFSRPVDIPSNQAPQHKIGLPSIGYSEDSMFSICFLAVMLGLLILTASPTEMAMAPVILSSGSQCFYAFTFSVLANAGRKNPQGALMVITSGFAVSSIGSFFGFLFADLIHAAALTYPDLPALATAGFAFVLLAYIQLGMKSYRFSQQFDRVVPIDEDGVASKASILNNDIYNARFELISQDRGLTAREKEVAQLLARGRNGAYIQEKLVISRNTTKTHIRHIYNKLEVHSQQELIDLFGER